MMEKVIIAAFGGLIYCLLPLIEYAKKPKESRPDLKDWYVLAQFVFYPFLGGLLAYVCEGDHFILTKARLYI